MLGHKKAQNTTTCRVTCLMLIGLLLTACGGTTPATTHTIGVVNYVPALDQVFVGFKAKMTTLGYVEGKNVTYIYHGTLDPDPQVIEREVKRLIPWSLPRSLRQSKKGLWKVSVAPAAT